LGGTHPQWGGTQKVTRQKGNEMALIHALEVMEELKKQRMMQIEGIVRTCKSALAFRIAYELLTKHGYRQLITNVDSVWTTNRTDITLREGKYLDAVIILDEAGNFLDVGRDAKGYLMGLGKLNTIIISPSTNEIAQRMRYLKCHRLINLAGFGAKGQLYGVKSAYDKKQRGSWFFWQNPSEVYGIYDTLPAAFTDRGIGAFIIDCIENLGKEDVSTYYSLSLTKASFTPKRPIYMDEGKRDNRTIRDEKAALFEEVQERLESTLKDLESVSVLSTRSNKRGR
jgi:hypothetical protein